MISYSCIVFRRVGSCRRAGVKEGLLRGLNRVLEDVGVEVVVGVLLHHNEQLCASGSVAGSLPEAVSAQGQRVSVLGLN